jgi:hypothetical protein
MKQFLYFTAVLFSISVMIGGCCNCRKTAAANNGHWSNPEILRVNDPRIESSFDFEGKHEFEQEESSVDAFIVRNNKHFSNSNGLTLGEADNIYRKLFEKGVFKNEPVGMPSPDYEPSIEALDDFKQRVALRKTEQDGTYQFFLLKTGCGYTYILGSIKVVENSQDIVIDISDRIHLSVPC